MNAVFKEFDSFCRRTIELTSVDAKHFTNPVIKEKFIAIHFLDVLRIIDDRIKDYNSNDAIVIAEMKGIANHYLNNYKLELKNG